MDLNNKKKYLIINSSNSFWGSETSLLIFLESLSTQDFKLIINKDGSGFSDRLSDKGIEFELTKLELSPKKMAFFKSLYYLFKTLIESKIKIIYGNNEDLSSLIAVVKIISLFRVETTIHLRNTPKKMDYFKKLMFIHNNIICNSKFTKKKLTESLITIPKSKIHIIVNAHGQKKESFEKSKTVKRNIKKNEPYFLTVGMISKGKAQFDAIKALNSSNLFSKINYLVVGKNYEKNLYLEEIEKYLSEHSLSHKVLIKHFENELGPLYSSAIALIVPSKKETFGRVVIESGFYGAPIIARNIEPLNELIEHGKTGLLWDGTEKHLGSLVDLLLGDNKLRNYLGKNLRSKVIKDFGNEKYFKSVKKILIRN